MNAVRPYYTLSPTQKKSIRRASQKVPEMRTGLIYFCSRHFHIFHVFRLAGLVIIFIAAFTG